MQVIIIEDANVSFNEIINIAQYEPVQIINNSNVVGVVLSAMDYSSLQSFYAERLRQSFRESATDAYNAGLTEENLTLLLADES